MPQFPVLSLQGRLGKLRSRPVTLKGRFRRNDGAHRPDKQSPIGTPP
jgi:hypothetical protein